MLVLTGRPVGLPFQSPVADAGLLRQEVKRAALSADVSDLPAALEAVLPQLASSRTTNKEIFVISDFQRKDVDGWIRGGDAAGTRPERAGGDSTGTIAALPKGVKVYLIPVTEKAQPNASIERLRYDSASGIGGGGRVTATVVNQGDDPVTDRVIRLTAASGGPSLADALVSIPPHGSEEVRMDLPAAPPEGGGLCVRLGSDPLEWDNEAWLVTGEPGVRKVLVVSGPETPATPSESRIAEAEQPAGSGSGPAGGSAGTTAGGTAGAEAAASGAAAATDRTPGARFIRLALDPGGNAEFYQVREADPGALNDPSALDADVVILSDVGRLSDAAVENLVRFRARGGGILIGLGDHVDPRSYNTSILGKLTSIELLNISQDEGAGAFRSLRPTVAAHPIFSGFPIGPGDDLSSARFRKVMTSRVGQGARVIAEFGRDVPAVIEDEGVLVFTSSLDGEWTDFVTSASYPPLLHQMVRYLIGRGGGERSGKVGARLETLLPETAVQGSVTMAGPDGGTEPVEAVPVERTIRLRSQPATQPGIYKFVDGSGRTVAAFAVNLDAREGDLALAAPQAENRLFGRESRRLEPGEKVNRELLEGRSGRELWRPLLVVVLLLLVVESVLGRGRILG